MENDIIFRVPDISICPKFSLDRHKPQSRLQNFHTLDYEEEMFIDLSYCDKSFGKTVNPNTLNVSLTDFSSLLATRKGSTSTPFRGSFSLGSHKPPKKQQLGSVSEDSGFNETTVASSFANSCVIASPVQQRNKRPRDVQSFCSIEETSVLDPLPCLSLQKRFENLLSDSDISNDSADVSFVDVQLENTQRIEEESFVSKTTKKEDEPSVALSQAFSNASSGYGSLCSQSSVLDQYLSDTHEATKAQISEQVVPEFVVKSNEVTRDDSISAPIILSETHDATQTFSKKLKKVLDKFSPKDPERIIGRKIGLEHVDIISELRCRSAIPPLDMIFRYVDDADLCSLSCVSKSCHAAVDSLARSRRVAFVKESKRVPETEKENHNRQQRITKKPVVVSRGLTGCKSQHPLATLQQSSVTTGTPLRAPASETSALLQPQSKYQQFVEAAATLKSGESLRKCPKCSGPSRVHTAEERAVCLSRLCAYDFCIKCRRPSHGAADCVSGVSKKSRSDTVTAPVGSKKSKKALRRL